MAEAVVSIVVGRLTDLLTEESQLLHGVKEEIEQVVTELRRIKTFLPDADSRIDEHEARNLVADVRELAYDAEHVVETFLLKALSSGKIIQWIKTNKFSRKIRDILQKRMSLLFDGFHVCNIKSRVESPSSSSRTPKILKRFYSYATPEPELFVGFDGDVDLLVKHLVNESTDDCYKLVSICGMGGLGKTTLARKIYHHHTIKACFAGLAWVSISQKWQRKQVLQRILICLVREKKEEILTWNEDKLGENLLDIQQTKKCLIVLDDIWSTDAWDSLKGVIPSEGSISKIMLTTRIVNVAEHANPNGFIHRPVLLSPEKKLGTTPVESTSSRRRLSSMPDSGLRNSQKYAKYRNKAISITSDITRDVTKMEELGREMVGNCGGLPLAIVTLGGILATKPSLIEWNKVHDDIISSLKSGKGLGRDYQSQILNILGWSYNDLPPQLKPCFLYLGKFGEDESIDAETLYQLWIAEGMVQSSDKKEGETMMKVAESYLGELVHKSMVQVRFNDVKSSINFESCSLHDLMRDLAVSQAEAEEFFKVIDLREENDFHSSPSADFRPCNTRQLIVHLGDGYRSKRSYDYFGKKADQQRYRSMLVFNKFGLRRSPPARGSHIANFRCLRVLSIEDESYPPRSGSFSRINLRRVLGILVYLRYLRISYDNLLFFHRYKS